MPWRISFFTVLRETPRILQASTIDIQSDLVWLMSSDVLGAEISLVS